MNLQNFFDHATNAMNHTKSQQQSDRIVSTFCKGAVMHEGGRGKALREDNLQELQALLEEGNEYRGHLKQQVKWSYQEKWEWDKKANLAQEQWQIEKWAFGKTERANEFHDNWFYCLSMKEKNHQSFVAYAKELLKLRKILHQLKVAISGLSSSERAFIPAPSHTGPQNYEDTFETLVANHAEQIFQYVKDRLRCAHMNTQQVFNRIRTGLKQNDLTAVLENLPEVMEEAFENFFDWLEETVQDSQKFYALVITFEKTLEEAME